MIYELNSGDPINGPCRSCHYYHHRIQQSIENTDMSSGVTCVIKTSKMLSKKVCMRKYSMLESELENMWIDLDLNVSGLGATHLEEEILKNPKCYRPAMANK